MINVVQESEKRFSVVGYNDKGNIIFSKDIEDRKDAINYCKRNKDRFYYIEVDDNVVGHCIYNPYEGIE